LSFFWNVLLTNTFLTAHSFLSLLTQQGLPHSFIHSSPTHPTTHHIALTTRCTLMAILYIIWQLPVHWYSNSCR